MYKPTIQKISIDSTKTELRLDWENQLEKILSKKLKRIAAYEQEITSEFLFKGFLAHIENKNLKNLYRNITRFFCSTSYLGVTKMITQLVCQNREKQILKTYEEDFQKRPGTYLITKTALAEFRALLNITYHFETT